MGRSGRQRPRDPGADHRAQLTGAIAVLDLTAAAPPTGAPAAFVVRQAGFSVRVFRPPPAAPSPVPPGQGQLLVPLAGRVGLVEVGGDAGKVVMQQRPDRELELGTGDLFRLANDARWTLRALSPDALVLAVATSVPRETHRLDHLLARAERRRTSAPWLLFENEVFRAEAVAVRGWLPGRGWVPWLHAAPDVEVVVGLAGRAHGEVRGDAPWRGSVGAGQLLEIPPGAPHRFGARGGSAVALLLSGRMARSSGAIDRRDLSRAFTPFAR